MESCEFLFIEVPDTYGISRGLLLSKEFYQKNKDRGIPLELTGTNSLTPRSDVSEETPSAKLGYPDGYFYPDESTVRQLDSDTVTLFGDFRSQPNNPASEFVHSCSRGILSKALDKLSNMGFRIYGAFEYEFYLYKCSDVKELTELTDSTYFMKSEAVKDYMTFTKDVMRSLKNNRISPEYNKLEYGNGQFEITISPAYGMEIADNALRFKEIVKLVAKRHGYFASFVSKPSNDAVSSSAHLNISIWNNEGENLFYDCNSTDNLSIFLKYWIAGLQYHVKALTCLSASTINCYSRLNSNFTPKDNSWAINNRLTCFRVKNFDRERTYVENRIPGAATNPYVALAALIYAGLDGLENKFPLKGPSAVVNDTKPNSVSKLPESMQEGIKCLKEDSFICETIGQNFITWFVRLREKELKEHEQAEKVGRGWEWQKANYLGNC